MTRLEKLKELEKTLNEAMKEADVRLVAPIAKQYRETIKEIEEIEGSAEQDDEISRLLNGVARTNGKDCT